MSNPWERSLQEATLSSFLDQLDSCSGHRNLFEEASLKSYTAMIAAKLDDDPSDLITRLRSADAVIARCGDLDRRQGRSIIIVDREARTIDALHKELLVLLEELRGNVCILEAGKNSRASLVQMLRRDTAALEHALLEGVDGGGVHSSSYTAVEVQQCVQSCRRLIDRMDAEGLGEGGLLQEEIDETGRPGLIN
jgi:hypothetical protein